MMDVMQLMMPSPSTEQVKGTVKGRDIKAKSSGQGFKEALQEVQSAADQGRRTVAKNGDSNSELKPKQKTPAGTENQGVDAKTADQAAAEVESVITDVSGELSFIVPINTTAPDGTLSAPEATENPEETLAAMAMKNRPEPLVTNVENNLITGEETSNSQGKPNNNAVFDLKLVRRPIALLEERLTGQVKPDQPLLTGEIGTGPEFPARQSPWQGLVKTVYPTPWQLMVAEKERLQLVSDPGLTGTETPSTTTLTNLTTSMSNLSEADQFMTGKPVPQPEVSSRDIIDQIVKSLEISTANRRSSAVTIKLEPEFLGKLHINLEVKDNSVIARFSTENQQVKHLLESGFNQLRSHLETSGIRLEKAEVNIDLGQHWGEFQSFSHSGQEQRQSARFGAPENASGYFWSGSGPPEAGDSVAGQVRYVEGAVDYLV